MSISFKIISAAACLLSLLNQESAFAAESVHDEKLQISFVVPTGFVPAPAELRLPGFPYNFASDIGQPERSIVIRVRGAGKRLAGNDLSTEDLETLRAQLPDAERFTEEWKAIPMDGLKTITHDPDGVDRVHYALPISTEPEAILVWLSGPATREAEVRDHLKAVIGGLEGTPASPPLPANRFVLKNKHLVLATVVLLLVGFLGWRMSRRKRIRLVKKID